MEYRLYECWARNFRTTYRLLTTWLASKLFQLFTGSSGTLFETALLLLPTADSGQLSFTFSYTTGTTQYIPGDSQKLKSG